MKHPGVQYGTMCTILNMVHIFNMCTSMVLNVYTNKIVDCLSQAFII